MSFRWKVVIFFAALVFSTSAWCQDFEAGLLGGLVASQVDGDHLGGFHKIGIKAGGFVTKKAGRNFFLKFELEFIQKGSRRPLNTDEITYYLMRLNYAEAVLVAGYSLGAKWSLEAGPAFGVLISAREENEFGELLNRPLFQRTDLTACGGANYKITSHFGVNLRYGYSVFSIREKNRDNNYFYFSRGQFNKLVSVALFYSF